MRATAPSSPTSSTARRSIARSWRRRASRSDRAAGGLADIAQLPLTEKREIRATCTPDNPIGAHLCAAPSEIVRIYSTSGTTGTPSYIPLTAGDLDNWVTGVGAQLRSLRRRRRPAHRHHLQRRAVRGGRGARRLRPHRPLPHPGRHREHRAADARRSSCCGPRPRCSRPPMRPTSSSGRRSGTSICAGRASSACSWRVSPAAASRPSARSSRRAGARGSPRRWASATSASRSGASARQQDGMHLGARGFVHAELIDPETGAALEMDDGATGELVLTHLRHRAAPLLRFRTRDHVAGPDEPVRMRPHEPARAVHRANRRHAHRPRRQRLPVGRPRGGERVRARGQRPHPRQAAGARA